MIFDRFGYFEGRRYQFWHSIVRSGDYYGLDQDDPVYRQPQTWKQGDPWCEACHLHAAADRRYPCDVMRARAADIEAAGYPATFCRKCFRAMPVRDGQTLPECWACERVTAKSRRIEADGTVRVPDGAGCSEKVPLWMTEANYGRGE